MIQNNGAANALIDPIVDTGRRAPASSLLSKVLETPAFVVDTATLTANIKRVRRQLRDTDIRLLFALKSFSIFGGLKYIAREVDGFAASSLFEAKLAKHLCQPLQTIHLTSPSIKQCDIRALCQNIDYLSFNSLSQWLRFSEQVLGRISCGLRVNPGLSFVKDERYNPCCRQSKLGVFPWSRFGKSYPNNLTKLMVLRAYTFTRTAIA